MDWIHNFIISHKKKKVQMASLNSTKTLKEELMLIFDEHFQKIEKNTFQLILQGQ